MTSRFTIEVGTPGVDVQVRPPRRIELQGPAPVQVDVGKLGPAHVEVSLGTLGPQGPAGPSGTSSGVDVQITIPVLNVAANSGGLASEVSPFEFQPIEGSVQVYINTLLVDTLTFVPAPPSVGSLIHWHGPYLLDPDDELIVAYQRAV